MSEFTPTSREKYPDLGFSVATTVPLQDGGELLLGHTALGDFCLQPAPTSEEPKPKTLLLYHSQEPRILAHTLLHMVRGSSPEARAAFVAAIEEDERQIEVGPLRYPHRNIDESIDRRYDKSFKRYYIEEADDDAMRPLELTRDGYSGNLKTRLYRQEDGILFTEEDYDDEVDTELLDDEDGFSIPEKLSTVESRVLFITNEDLPAFATALIASARTDYGRVSHADMIQTLRNMAQ
jgi:hypothetical protein